MNTQLLEETSDKLLQIINDAKERFKSISAEEWNTKPAPEKWSKKEILGHLIDSAANNHLRFVRAQLADDIYTGIAYEQDFFVSSQHYATAEVEEVIELWYAYNRHLAFIIKYIDPTKLDVLCHIGDYPPVLFSFIITDYINHLLHHLKKV